MGSTTVALEEKHINYAHKHVIMRLICTQKCCRGYLAGSFGQAISPLATILLIPCGSWGDVKEYCGLREWLFIAVVFTAAARQAMISQPFPASLCNVPRIRSRNAEAWQGLRTEEAAEQSCRMLLVGTFPWIPCDVQHPGVGGRCWCEAQNASGSAEDMHRLSVSQQESPGRAGWGGKGHSLCPASLGPTCYNLLIHQGRFGHQGPHLLTLRFESTLPKWSRVKLCCLAWFTLDILLPWFRIPVSAALLRHRLLPLPIQLITGKQMYV